MKSSCIVLVSNIALPAKKIGSWTTRIDRFNEEKNTIDYVLSPNAMGQRYIYCKKQKFLTYKAIVRKQMLKYWVAKDYIKELKRLAKKHSKITVLVMDDLHLLEAVAMLKKKSKTEINLIFSFHGYEFTLPNKLQQSVDKILFLTHLGLAATRSASNGLLPATAVIGNAVDSQQFVPVSQTIKIEQRKKFGIDPNTKVFIWMANDRPIKGLYLYRQLASHYRQKNANALFLVIGNSVEYQDNNCRYFGKVNNQDLAQYLQLGDFYLFTTQAKEGFGLSVIEAYKCGNFVIAPKTGGLPEVLKGLPNKAFVDSPNKLVDWIAVIDKVIGQNKEPLDPTAAALIWPYSNWTQAFLNAIT